MTFKINKTTIDTIIKEMKEVVVKSKDDIFFISEEAYDEYTTLKRELANIKEKIAEHIKLSEELELQVKNYRKKLSIVSKEFDIYSEEQIRSVYDETYRLQTELTILNKEEVNLRSRRDDIDRRIIRLKNTIQYAEKVGGKVSSILTYLEDDFKELNEALKSARETQEFGFKIIEAQEEERKKLSRDIHDGPAQTLANLLIRSEIVDRSFREGGVDIALTEIKIIRETIRQSLLEVRRIIYDLRPMALDDLGLLPTLKKYVSNISNINKVKVTLSHSGLKERISPHYEVAVFRLGQEAIQNAVKHAQATEIKVILDITYNSINLIVKDDGVGFNPNIKSEDSFGIIGMRERVELLKGEFSINSTVNKGTRVTINIPIIEE